MAKTFQELLDQINKSEKSSKLSYSEAMLKASEILETAINTKMDRPGPTFDGTLKIGNYRGIKRSTGEGIKSWVLENDDKQLLSFIQIESGKCAIDIDPDGTSGDTEYELEDNDAKSIKGIFECLIDKAPEVDEDTPKGAFANFASKLANSSSNPVVRDMLKNIIGVPASEAFERKLAKKIGEVLENLNSYKYAWDENIMQVYEKGSKDALLTLSIDPDDNVCACFGTVNPNNSNMRLSDEGAATITRVIDKIKATQKNCMEEIHPLSCAMKRAMHRGGGIEDLLKAILSR